MEDTFKLKENIKFENIKIKKNLRNDKFIEYVKHRYLSSYI